MRPTRGAYTSPFPGFPAPDVEPESGLRWSPISVVHNSQVPRRSPLIYPGGKTWLIPHIRSWLTHGEPVTKLVEPFAGGGTASLTAVMEGLAEHANMIELDHDVAMFWIAALEHTTELIDLVMAFQPTREAIEALPADTVVSHGFRTLVLSNTQWAGKIKRGTGFPKDPTRRWYPEMTCERLLAIAEVRERLTFTEGDGLRHLRDSTSDAGAAFFIDPPYTADGGKQAGATLYAHHAMEHAKLFEILAEHRPNFLMTYDNADEIISLVHEHRFHAVVVAMRSNQNVMMRELVISREPLFV